MREINKIFGKGIWRVHKKKSLTTKKKVRAVIDQKIEVFGMRIVKFDGLYFVYLTQKKRYHSDFLFVSSDDDPTRCGKGFIYTQLLVEILF